MTKYYCKQVDPEWQEDNLFYTYQDKNSKRNKLGWNDDIYADNVIIDGNNDYLFHYTSAYEKVKKIYDILYEYDLTINPKSNHCYWDSVSALINYYLSKENGKNYSTREIHQWKELLKDWDEREEEIVKALELITDKKWRKTTIRGCCQRDWQYLYVSEEITDNDVRYIEMCYFNTGTEWLVYESEEDFEKEESIFSLYVDSYNAKQKLSEYIGCKEEELVCYEFDGYTKTPKYKEI